MVYSTCCRKNQCGLLAALRRLRSSGLTCQILSGRFIRNTLSELSPNHSLNFKQFLWTYYCNTPFSRSYKIQIPFLDSSLFSCNIVLDQNFWIQDLKTLSLIINTVFVITFFLARFLSKTFLHDFYHQNVMQNNLILVLNDQKVGYFTSRALPRPNHYNSLALINIITVCIPPLYEGRNVYV